MNATQQTQLNTMQALYQALVELQKAKLFFVDNYVSSDSYQIMLTVDERWVEIYSDLDGGDYTVTAYEWEDQPDKSIPQEAHSTAIGALSAALRMVNAYQVGNPSRYDAMASQTVYNSFADLYTSVDEPVLTPESEWEWTHNQMLNIVDGGER